MFCSACDVCPVCVALDGVGVECGSVDLGQVIWGVWLGSFGVDIGWMGSFGCVVLCVCVSVLLAMSLLVIVLIFWGFLHAGGR